MMPWEWNTMEISAIISNEILEKLESKGFDATNKHNPNNIKGEIHTAIFETLKQYLDGVIVCHDGLYMGTDVYDSIKNMHKKHGKSEKIMQWNGVTIQ